MSLKLNSTKFNRTKIALIEVASTRLILDDAIMTEMFKYLAENLRDERLIDDVGEALICVCGCWSNFVIKNFESFLECKKHFPSKNLLFFSEK